MNAYQINLERCSGCGQCAKACPNQAIQITNRKATILAAKCRNCGKCINACHRHSIQLIGEGVPVQAGCHPVPQSAWRKRHGQSVQRWRQRHHELVQSILQ